MVEFIEGNHYYSHSTGDGSRAVFPILHWVVFNKTQKHLR